MENLEIEIQANIENVIPLSEFLENKGAFKYENHQIDEYFTPAHRDFVETHPVKEWLRLRNSDGKYSLNYKNWYYDENGKSMSYCEEREIKIDDIFKLKDILDFLNFKSLVVVDKIRKVRKFKDYEIAVDKVEDLGDFVEIEYIGSANGAEPTQIIAEMKAFLKNLNCGKIILNTVGYPYQLLFPSKVKYEEL